MSLFDEVTHGLRPGGAAVLEPNRTNTIRASEITPEQVQWLWPGFVPLGFLSVVTGLPGVGKSTIDYDLAARTSREGKAVLVVTAEDHLAAVVRPRLEAAEADLGRIFIVTSPITLPDDVGLLKRLVQETDAALLILDPLVALIGEGVNTHRDHHVRRVLAPLSALAEETGSAVLVVIHAGKGDNSDPLLRVLGSIGFTGAARMVLVAADDPQDESRRIFAVIKSNLAEKPAPLAYVLEGVELGEGISTSRVRWLGEAPEVDIRGLLGRSDPEDRSAMAEAVEFLQAVGVRESACPARDLERDAGSLGIHEKALQRARRQLGIPVWKDGFPGVWYWGPKPTRDLDTRTGHPTHIQLSSSVPPAQTGPQVSDLDNADGVGGKDDARTAFEVLSSSESEEWYTPPEVVDRVLEVLGEVDLDPCAKPGEPTVPTKRLYRKADDGLRQPWEGRVYLNPPYGRAIHQWVRKLVDEYRWGHVTEAIALVPARTDTSWFALLGGFPRCEVSGRLTFANAVNPAPFPSVVFYVGPNAGRFREVFSTLGRIVQPVDAPERDPNVSGLEAAAALIRAEFDAEVTQ